MTIPTPTSDRPEGGLLDVGVLNQIAGQFFAALPGAAGIGAPQPANPIPGNPVPGGANAGPLAKGPVLPGTVAPGANLAPTTPQDGGAIAASFADVHPHAAAANRLPDLATTVAPAIDSQLGGQTLGVPQAAGSIGHPSTPQVGLPGPALPTAGGLTPPLTVGGAAPAPGFPQVPQVSTSPASSGSPFYFLDEARPAATGVPAPTADLVSARSFGLPGEADLRALLGEPPASDPHQASPYSYVPAAARTPEPGIPLVPQRGLQAFDVHAVRRDFPILQERVNGRPLVWFDNAATTQKPTAVIDRLSDFYRHENSNIHRAAHELAARATDAYEKARNTVARFIGAPSAEEIIFVRGTTEGINLIARTWGVKNIEAGDEIIVSHLEHHANIVPWQLLAWEKGAKIKVIPVDNDGQVILEEYQRLITPKTKLVSVTQVSNALGTVVPVKEIVSIAHRHGLCAVVDGAQSVSHMRVDVQDIGADFFVFSGHKIFGPTGIGAVYGRRAVLEDLPPYQGGGNMIADVTFERTIFHKPPTRFEAGTGNVADAAGLGAALEYVERVGIEAIGRYEHELLVYATERLAPIKGVRLIGTAPDKASVLSFVLDGYAPEEVGRALNEEGIAVRAGHHCAQPILRRFGLEASVRPSLAFYNTCDEVDRFISVIRRLARA